MQVIHHKQTMPTLSLTTARVLSLSKQCLDRRRYLPNKKGILSVVRKIGLIQIDAVTTVARNHYLVAFSRVGKYDLRLLDDLQNSDHKILEQWAHVASLIPIEDFRNFWPMIVSRRFLPMRYGQRKALGKNPQKFIDDVLWSVEKDGPLTASDIDNFPRGRKAWWNRRPARAALDWLFYCGYLVIRERNNFTPCYDLTGRMFSAEELNQGKTLEDWYRWVTLRSVGCLGVGTIQHIADYYRQPIKSIRNTITTLTSERKLVEIQVEGWADPAYLLSSDLGLIELISHGEIKPSRTTFLAPFDNLIWNRNRVRELFNFDYRVEMYKPASVRTQGYYVMPILHLDRLVGRIDQKLDRANQLLIIRDLSLEGNQHPSNQLIEGIFSAVIEIMDFLDCHELIVEHSQHSFLKRELMRAVKGSSKI